MLERSRRMQRRMYNTPTQKGGTREGICEGMEGGRGRKVKRSN